MASLAAATPAFAVDLPIKADDVVLESSAVPKRFRKARRAACAGLVVALAFVGLLVAEILLTHPRRGAMKPLEIELYLNQVRPFRVPSLENFAVNDASQ